MQQAMVIVFSHKTSDSSGSYRVQQNSYNAQMISHLLSNWASLGVFQRDRLKIRGVMWMKVLATWSLVGRFCIELNMSISHRTWGEKHLSSSLRGYYHREMEIISHSEIPFLPSWVSYHLLHNENPLAFLLSRKNEMEEVSLLRAKFKGSYTQDPSVFWVGL